MTHEAFSRGYEDGPRPEVQVTKLVDGLGFGHGAISSALLEQQPGNEDLARLTDEAITHPDLLSPISTDKIGQPITDDGCGDGRRTGLIFQRGGDGKPDRMYKASLLRSKVFGGGLTMGVASGIAVGDIADTALTDAFTVTQQAMRGRGVDYGAHTALHTHGDTKTGCGAIDLAPQIVGTAVQYRNEIRQTVVALYGESAELDAALDNYVVAAAADNSTYDSRKVMNDIIDDGKVVKALADDHQETRIVLNYVPGFTADQNFVREYTGSRAQVFSVDVWRMQEIAAQMYDDPADRERAFVGELIYTLATAAVLTKGDLPVYAVQQLPEA